MVPRIADSSGVATCTLPLRQVPVEIKIAQGLIKTTKAQNVLDKYQKELNEQEAQLRAQQRKIEQVRPSLFPTGPVCLP